MNSQSCILRNRIKFAVRRCTGRVVDIDAMLGRPELRGPRIQAWRKIGSDHLNALLDELESEFVQQDMASNPPQRRKPAARTLKGIQLVPGAPRAS